MQRYTCNGIHATVYMQRYTCNGIHTCNVIHHYRCNGIHRYTCNGRHVILYTLQGKCNGIHSYIEIHNIYIYFFLFFLGVYRYSAINCLYKFACIPLTIYSMHYTHSLIFTHSVGRQYAYAWRGKVTTTITVFPRISGPSAQCGISAWAANLILNIF